MQELSRDEQQDDEWDEILGVEDNGEDCDTAVIPDGGEGRAVVQALPREPAVIGRGVEGWQEELGKQYEDELPFDRYEVISLEEISRW